MPAVFASPLEVVIGVVLYWLAIGVAGILTPLPRGTLARFFYPLGALGGVVLAGVGFAAVGMPWKAMILPLGLPDLPFHVRLDALSAYFLILLGATSAGISCYSAGYFAGSKEGSPGFVCLQYHCFLASMAAVIIADDAYLFMVAWETMALTSYFLVTTDHKVPEIRSAGFIYLLIAHVGAIAILLSFGVMRGAGGEYTFDYMRSATLPQFWASAAFLLALFGFGAKAGLLPLHVWLPEAHPAAPSPVSALMSGVMLKTAIYGLLRVALDLLSQQQWWWGVVALALGLLTALFGVMFAAVQTDMKRLLAYSSIENVGIIFAGIGLCIVFHVYETPRLAALALVATLYHCLNHAAFKSLLFLSTGSVMHATRERSLGRLGGLIRSMPWVGFLSLVGTLAIAGVPPLNGFVSEWLLLQAFLFSPGLPNPYLNMLVPVSAAAVVLAAALSGYVMVKFYGVVFLGRPREARLHEAHDAGAWERTGLAGLAAACLALGVFPLAVIHTLDAVTAPFVNYSIGADAGTIGWLLIAPVGPDRASYGPLLFLMGVIGAVLLTFLSVRYVYHGHLRRADPWDCGYPEQTARMQDTAEGFGQPIKQIFEPFFRIRREMPTPFDVRPVYRSSTEDRLWYWAYLPVARLADRVSSLVGRLQQGRIHIYLLYSFTTLVLLLLLAR